jgi:Holliday junction resolvase RusA-like endonuclease
VKIFTFLFKGKSVGVNRWHGARAVKGKGFIYEKAEYKHFKEEIAALALEQRAKTSGYVDAQITIWRYKIADTDSVVKPILDAMEKAGLYKNDNLVRNIIINRHYHKRGEPDMILIEFWEIPPEETEKALLEQQFGYAVMELENGERS